MCICCESPCKTVYSSVWGGNRGVWKLQNFERLVRSQVGAPGVADAMILYIEVPRDCLAPGHIELPRADFGYLYDALWDRRITA